VSKVTPSRDWRKLTVRGHAAAAASGNVTIALAARVGRRNIALTKHARLPGRSTFAFSVTLPKAARTFSRLKITVRFAGTARVAPGSASMTLVRAR
jgi:hypothetical protein